MNHLRTPSAPLPLMQEGRPLRILHVMDHSLPELSGYAVRSRYIIRTQRAMGFDSRVVTSARHRNFQAPYEEIEELRIWRTPWPSSGLQSFELKIPFWRERVLTAALAKRTIEAAAEFQPDVLHAHSPLFNGQAALRAGRALKIPVVYEIRAFWEDDSVSKGKFREGSPIWRAVRALETKVCRGADHVTVICRGLRDDLIQRGIPADGITIIGNGIDATSFPPQEKDHSLSAELGLAGKTVIGFFGTFAYYEGLPDLVQAFAALVPRYPNLRLLLVGAGEAEAEIRAKIAAAGVQEEVVLMGRVPHARMASFYSIVDALAYPRVRRRITELTTPLKPLEAFCMEKTVFGSDAGGVKELLDDVGAGRLFKADDPADLARALAEWLDEPEESRAAERRLSRERVLARRAWTGTVAPIAEVYGRLVKRTS